MLGRVLMSHRCYVQRPFRMTYVGMQVEGGDGVLGIHILIIEERTYIHQA